MGDSGSRIHSSQNKSRWYRLYEPGNMHAWLVPVHFLESSPPSVIIFGRAMVGRTNPLFGLFGMQNPSILETSGRGIAIQPPKMRKGVYEVRAHS